MVNDIYYCNACILLRADGGCFNVTHLEDTRFLRNVKYSNKCEN